MTYKSFKTGDEVVFLGQPQNTWKKVRDYGMLEKGEAYVVEVCTPIQVSLAGVPGLFDKNLFEKI